MKYNNVLGDKISALGFGCMRFPTVEIDGVKVIDREQAFALLDRAYSSGVNYFDTAYFYHDKQSEKLLGDWLRGKDRGSYRVATKMPVNFITRAEQVAPIFEEQLRNLGTGYFDYYLMHALSYESFLKSEKMGVYDFLKEKQKQGYIRHLGFSFHDTPEALEKIVSAREFEFGQIQFNYIDYDIQRASEQYEILRDHGLEVIVMEPVRGGTLAQLPRECTDILDGVRDGRSYASYALRYVGGYDTMTILSGMSSMEQVEDNINTFANFVLLTQEESKAIEECKQAYISFGNVPCTGCRYCMEKCTHGVAIPDVFKIYNEYNATKNVSKYVSDAKALKDVEHWADECWRCGDCEKVCPQHISISEYMRRIDARLSVEENNK